MKQAGVREQVQPPPVLAQRHRRWVWAASSRAVGAPGRALAETVWNTRHQGVSSGRLQGANALRLHGGPAAPGSC